MERQVTSQWEQIICYFQFADSTYWYLDEILFNLTRLFHFNTLSHLNKFILLKIIEHNCFPLVNCILLLNSQFAALTSKLQVTKFLLQWKRITNMI